MSQSSKKYIPALRYDQLTRFYDPLLQITLKETKFKKLLIQQASVRPGHRVLDIGCGTATLTIMLKQQCPDAEVIGLDGDPQILKLAAIKIREAAVTVDLREGLASEAPFEAGTFDRIVSSLMFHHLSTIEKVRTLKRLQELLRPGGELHIADWGKAQNMLMRVAFLSIQILDGFETTNDNVKGNLPKLMTDAGFASVEETHREMTIFGTLSLYKAISP